MDTPSKVRISDRLKPRHSAKSGRSATTLKAVGHTGFGRPIATFSTLVGSITAIRVHRFKIGND